MGKSLEETDIEEYKFSCETFTNETERKELEVSRKVTQSA